jgi:hypothetical protein
MKVKEYIKKVEEDDSCGIFYPPTDAQTGLDVLINHFLGEDWYDVNPVTQKQVNTKAILEIIYRYPKPRIRKWFNKIMGGNKMEKTDLQKQFEEE